jgi:hypothetical protein
MQEQVLQEALEAARKISQDEDRGKALMHLVPYLPQSMRQHALREAVAVAWGLSDRSFFHTLGQELMDMVSRLTGLPYPELAFLWSEVHNGENLLRFLAGRTRESLLSNLSALAPVIHKLDGEEAIAEVFSAIQDVGRWWP